MRQILLAALLVLPAIPGQAQDRPVLFPTRDVAVAYRLTTGGTTPAPMSMAWLTAANALRIEVAGLGWMVVDQRAGRAFLVMEAQRMVMDLPAEQATQFLPSASASFRRGGNDRVAGIACTVWTVTDRGNNGTACITADGVLLRGGGSSGGQSGSLEATSVTYVAQDPARFQRPAGYQVMPTPGPAPGAPPARPR